jgi:hypothetical protein
MKALRTKALLTELLAVMSVRQIVAPSLPWAERGGVTGADVVSYFHLLTSSAARRNTSSLMQQRSSESFFMRDQVSLAL